MLEREKQSQEEYVLCVNTDMPVSQDHLLRMINSVVDFSKIYEIVENLYSMENGRLRIDPVVLIKMALI